MNNKVGIFWFVENTLVYKTQNAIEVTRDRLGFVDSYLQHQVEWEENLIYEQFALNQHNTDYYNFPRGRVVFNFNLHTSFIYLDKRLFKKHILNDIKAKFSLANTSIKFFYRSSLYLLQ
ncbi:hypothetical protein [Pseudoalteromonas sp. ZZD1]|uniref:hypothetical protein n=1 Tax=Pseudoalteromonas sp. ZZD1 TaxID=3139395 RepID=UPI003BAA7673